MIKSLKQKINNTLFVSIDVGEVHTGIIFYYKEDEKNKIINYQIDNPNQSEVVNWISNEIINLKNNKAVVLIVEDFINYLNKKISGYQKNKTTQMIGMLINLANKNNYQLVLQRAVNAKIWTNERLIRLNIITYKKHRYYLKDNHIRPHSLDALRHLMYYLNKTFYNGCITFLDII